MINNLKLYRDKSKLTQLDLAKKAGVTRQTIISVENGRYLPSLTLSLKLANLFSCHVEDLFNLDDETLQ